MKTILVTSDDLILALGKEVVRSYLSQIGSFVEGAVVKGQINAERTMLNDPESELNETPAQLVSGDAFYAPDTERVITEMFLQIRTKILAIPGRCPSLVCHLRTLAEIEAVLQERWAHRSPCSVPVTAASFFSMITPNRRGQHPSEPLAPLFSGPRPPAAVFRVAGAPATRKSPCLTFGPTFVKLRPWIRSLSASDSRPTPRKAKSDFLSVCRTSTFMTRLSRAFPLGGIAEPEDVWSAVLFFVSSGSDFITGQTLYLDGGITATQ